MEEEVMMKEPTELDFDIPTSEELDFYIPTSEESYVLMVECFASIGLVKWEIDKAIKNKRTAYNRACWEFKKQMENE